MIDALWAITAGIALGLIFFGGLWWTVRHMAAFRWPATTVLVSAMLRMAVVLGGLYGIAGGNWQRVLFGLLGILIARLAVTGATRKSLASMTAERRHAP